MTATLLHIDPEVGHMLESLAALDALETEEDRHLVRAELPATSPHRHHEISGRTCVCCGCDWARCSCKCCCG